MSKVFIILSGRVINGILAFFVIVFINNILNSNVYVGFSKNIAYLTFLTTFSSGVMSSLFIRNGFKLKERGDGIVLLGILFFSLLSIVPIELSIRLDLFSDLHRYIIYIYVFLNIIFAISIADLQVKQKFYYAVFLDILRTIGPLGAFLYFKIQHHQIINLNIIFGILTLGNIFGVYYLLKNTDFYFFKRNEVSTYIKQNFKSDFIFGLGLMSFNSLSQYITGKDRDIISQIEVKNNANIAYTADLITKIINAFLFPFNTKISSELGVLYYENKIRKMYNNINIFSLLVLVLGIILTVSIYFIYLYFSFLPVLKNIDSYSIILYGLSNTFLMASIIYQKFFDYSKYKLLPALLLLLSIATVVITNKLSLHTNNFLLMTFSIYSILLFLTKHIILKPKEYDSLDD